MYPDINSNDLSNLIKMVTFLKNSNFPAALDPAQPGFEGCPPEVRLNRTDFIFLDVLHTNGKPLGLGFVTSLGIYKKYKVT